VKREAMGEGLFRFFGARHEINEINQTNEINKTNEINQMNQGS
jgi:hypothetical protein